MPPDHRRTAAASPARESPLRLERARFLAEASRLLAQTLDYEATLAMVARLAMPELGGWCIVDLVEEDGSVRRLSVTHPDPARQALAAELEARYPPMMEDVVGAPLVLRTREAELVREVTDEMLVAVARDARHLEIIRSLGMGSFIVVPMEARGRVVGCITFISAEAERRYDEDDLLLAQDLAARSALAVDNARLFRDAEQARAEAIAARAAAERERADALQVGVQAQESERAKTDFLSTMSHELRTPINAVVGYADLLMMGIAGPVTGEQRRYLDRLRGASDHLLGLVNDVLDVVKADANRLLVTQQLAEARGAVRSALVVTQPHATLRGIRLTATWTAEGMGGDDGVDGARLHYLGDPRRVEQVLINLLTNAIKFTPEGGHVEISLLRRVGTLVSGDAPAGEDTGPAERDEAIRPRWIGIRVTDSGPGIAPADQQRIFEPFVQLDASKTRVGGGSGLGLAISRRLARLMDGEVTVESRVGAGAVFTLWLRAAPPPERERPSDGVESAAAGERRGRERLARGLYEVGDALQREVDEVVLRYMERVRLDPGIGAAKAAPWTEIANHTATLLTDIAQSLGVVEEAAGDGALLMRVGEEIRRVVSDQHGLRRAQLGWTLPALERDFDILEEEIVAGVRRALPDAPAFPVEEGVGIMLKLLGRSREIAREALLRETGGR